MKTLILEYWLPLVVWLITIFFFSTDAFSGSETSRLIVPLLMFFFPGLSPHEIDVWHGVIRKFGHVTEYFILAVFAYRSLKYDRSDLIHAKLLTGIFVFASAIFDEYHQSLTLTRGASIVDVGYDCLGAVWALWIITTYESRRLHSHTVL